MSAEVKLSGPLFEGRLDVRAGLVAGLEAVAEQGATLVRRQLAMRTRYRTAKWGHVLEAVRTSVKVAPGGPSSARIFLGGQSAFVGVFLEGGARAHIEPRLRAVGRGKRGRLVRGRGRSGTILRFMMGSGLMFRRKVTQTGTPAYRWRETAQAELEPQIQGLLDKAMGAALAP